MATTSGYQKAGKKQGHDSLINPLKDVEARMFLEP